MGNGGELFDRLANQEQYGQKEAARAFEQMVEAVGYCHRMGVAHRDLKLENFIYESNSWNSQLKLIDFGLSKKYNGGGIRKMKSLVGTSYYMAPEVLDKSVKYGEKCDVWSLGVILYMLLIGQAPFDGENDFEIMQSISKFRIKFRQDDWRDMTDAQELVQRLLKPNPEKRPSCADILKDRWLQANCDVQAMHVPISKNAISNMQKYAHMAALKRTAVQVVAYTLTPGDIEELRSTFKSFDEDGSGTLTIQEFRKGMSEHKMLSNEEVDELFSKIDADNTGLISYSEFIACTLADSSVLTPARLAVAFDKLDPDSSGYIEARELRGLLTEFDDAAVEKIIASAEADGSGQKDGRISRSEFLELVSAEVDFPSQH